MYVCEPHIHMRLFVIESASFVSELKDGETITSSWFPGLRTLTQVLDFGAVLWSF